MSKLKYTTFISLAIFIAIVSYTAILFLLVHDKDTVFFVNYGFTLFSMLCFWTALLSVLSKPKTLDEAFLNEPYLSAAVIYVIIQVVFSLWSLLNPGISLSVNLSGDILLCGLYLIASLFLIVGISMNKSIEKNIREKRTFIRKLYVDISELSFTDENCRQAHKTLMEQIKYANPMSTEATSAVENEILQKSQNLQTEEDISQLGKLINKREKILKI